jgi:hypothetical protein
MKKAFAYTLIAVLVLNMLALALGYSNTLAFWAVIILVAIISTIAFRQR